MKIKAFFRRVFNRIVKLVQKQTGIEDEKARKLSILIVWLISCMLVSLSINLAISDRVPEIKALQVGPEVLLKNYDLIKRIDVFGTDNQSTQAYAIYAYWQNNDTSLTKVPRSSYPNLEQELLIKHKIRLTYKPMSQLPGSVPAVEGFKLVLSGIESVLSFLMMPLFLVIILYSSGAFGNKRFQIYLPHQIDGSMDDLVGMSDIKQDFLLLADLYENRAAFEAHGIKRAWNVLFSGPPGVGKTKLASLLAKRLDVPMISIDGSSLESGFIGGGSLMLRKISFQAKRMGRCVVFIDEGQTLLKRRGANRNGSKWEDDTSNTLLSLLDGVKSNKDSEVIWIIASNFDKNNADLDEAVLRRFQMKINFRLPNMAERKAMIETFLAKRDESVKCENIDFDLLARVTAGLSPAHLLLMVDQASFMSIRDKVLIDTKLLLKAHERASIGMTDRAQTAGMEMDREIVATHELGHFLAGVARYLRQGLTLAEAKRRSEIIKVSVESVSSAGALGFALLEQQEVSLYSKDDLRWKVRQLYGGRAAEEVVYGFDNITTGAESDIQAATKILVNMSTAYAMHDRSPVDFSLFRNTQGGIKSISGQEQVNVRRLAEELYRDTLSIIELMQPVMTEMRPRLLESYSLTKDELFLILEKHWPLLLQDKQQDARRSSQPATRQLLKEFPPLPVMAIQNVSER